MDHRVHDEPSDVEADNGEVQVDGPGGVVVSMTPGAAEVTGGKLIRKAAVAREQARETDTDNLLDEIDDQGNFA